MKDVLHASSLKHVDVVQLASIVCKRLWQQSDWHAAILILHKLSLQLPNSSNLPSSLTSLLTRLEASVPTHDAPVGFHTPAPCLSMCCHFFAMIISACNPAELVS